MCIVVLWTNQRQGHESNESDELADERVAILQSSTKLICMASG